MEKRSDGGERLIVLVFLGRRKFLVMGFLVLKLGLFQVSWDKLVVLEGRKLGIYFGWGNGYRGDESEKIIIILKIK